MIAGAFGIPGHIDEACFPEIIRIIKPGMKKNSLQILFLKLLRLFFVIFLSYVVAVAVAVEMFSLNVYNTTPKKTLD